MSDEMMKTKPVKTEEEWRKLLPAEEFEVLRKKGTERAFSGEYYEKKDAGHYHCKGCDSLLFSSDTKYDSGSGWPSFYQPVSGSAVAEVSDQSHGMNRTEVTCATCGGHLGHVFDDGPVPTGQRYCINSVSLDFQEKK